MNGSHLICFVNTVLACLAIVSAEGVLDKLKNDPELSLFTDVISRNPLYALTLSSIQATVFAPTNAAIEEWRRVKGNPNLNLTSDEAVAHITPALLKFENLPIVSQSTFSMATLFLMKKEGPAIPKDPIHVHEPKNVDDEFYVNNAKVVSGLTQTSAQGNTQHLFKIDRVIDSYKADRLPNALQLLDGTVPVPIDVRFSNFVDRVKSLGLSSLFSESGLHTFFVPVDGQSVELDQYQIRAHIIPNQVLPVRAFQGNKDYPSAMADENIHVTISKPEPLSPSSNYSGSKSESRIEVHCPYSNMTSHHLGTTRTGIVLGNIPVTNGIIHFIEAPFLVITDSIWDILDANKHGQLSKFYHLITQFPEVLSLAKSSDTMTVFAPSDEAFAAIDAARLNATLNNQTLAREVAKLHFYKGVVDTQIVKKDNYTHSKALDGRDLYYSIAEASESSKVLTVEGGGVNATAIHPDMGARNGRLHIINKVLGIPYQSVFEKVRDDYDLKITYLIGSRRNDLFNRILHRADTKFTYFAPSRDAWNNVQVTMPSEYKQLVHTNQYPLHGEHILERHVMAAPKTLTFDELKNMNGKTVVTMRGTLNVIVEQNDVFLEWEGQRARILRPDVNAVNGVIHLIDGVLMKKRDLASAAPATIYPSICVLSASFLTVVASFGIL